MHYRYPLLFACLLCTSLLYAATPVAVCAAAVNVALPPYHCEVSILPAMIDQSSYDPDGDPLSMSVSFGANRGPGTYWVRLNVSDATHTNYCYASVTVEDKFLPTITCANRTYYLVAPDQPHAIDVEQLVTVTDNCAAANAQTISVPDFSGYRTVSYSATTTDPGGNGAWCSGTITTVDGEPQNYCIPGHNATYEHIARLRLATATNVEVATSGNDGGYSHNYPTGNNILYHGSTYSLTYTPGFTYGTTYREYWSVYLDKNGDGDFTDYGERIHTWNGYGGNSFDLSVPTGFWGWSRLRVVMNYGGLAGPCGGGYGETEDLSVYLRPYFYFPWPGFRTAVPTAVAADGGEEADRQRLTEAPVVAGPELAKDVSLYPNPVRSGGFLTVGGSAPGGELVLRDLTGRALRRYPAGNPRLELPAGLPAGVYMLGGEEWTRRVVVR